GKKPFDSYQKYLATTEIEAVEGLEEGNLMVDIIIKDLNILLAKERLILEKASENADEGTASLMSDFISEQEKLIWMLTAYRS
ncbi:MAG: DNA starvation/stationary phase protection protein, partial [Flavobacteriaceae bacterium]|nr:DNA starvation/stationary phase protection protein [Flavobacteriaceae bacterium]